MTWRLQRIWGVDHNTRKRNRGSRLLARGFFPGSFNGREPSLDVAGAATIAITQEVNLFASLRLIEWRLMKNTGSEPDNRTTARRRH